MTAEPIDLEDLIALLRTSWPARYSRGRILHVHRNAIQLPNGSTIHLRIMVQQLSEPETEYHRSDTDMLLEDLK